MEATATLSRTGSSGATMGARQVLEEAMGGGLSPERRRARDAQDDALVASLLRPPAGRDLEELAVLREAVLKKPPPPPSAGSGAPPPQPPAGGAPPPQPPTGGGGASPQGRALVPSFKGSRARAAAVAGAPPGGGTASSTPSRRPSWHEDVVDDVALASLVRSSSAGRRVKDPPAPAPSFDDVALRRACDAEDPALASRLLPHAARDLAEALRRASQLPPAEVVVGGMGIGDCGCQLHCPLDVAAGYDGSIIVADTGNYRVLRFRQGARDAEVVADGFDFEAVGVAAARDGSLFVSSGGPGTARVVELWRPGALRGVEVARGAWPTGLALEDDTGACVWVVDTFEQSVSRYLVSEDVAWREVIASGALCESSLTPCWWLDDKSVRPRRRGPPEPRPFVVPGGGGAAARGACATELRRPFAVAVLPGGDALIADSGNHRVLRWARGARVGAVVAGGRGRGAALWQLSFPKGVVAESGASLLVADTGNHRVLRWRLGAGRGELLAGGRGAGCRGDQLHHPVGLALDHRGGLLVADSRNHRIVRVALRESSAPLAVLSLDPSVPRPVRTDEEEPWETEVLDAIRDKFHPGRSGMSIEDIFSRLDRLESAEDVLSLVEFDRIVRTYRPDLPLQKVKRLFALVNASRSGKISLEEFSRRLGAAQE